MKKPLLILLLFFLLPLVVFAVEKVDINIASLEQLDQLTGIGPALAQRIIDSRPYNSLDDLLKVKGIGEKSLQKIKEQGLAYVSGSSTITQPKENTAKEVQVATTATQPTYIAGVVINEILPAPEGADDQDEWIEIYNSTSQEISLGGWKLKDTEGTITTYTFKEQSLPAYAYIVLKRPTTKIVLNDAQDTVNLLWPNEIITSSASYQKAPKNQSYNRVNNDWQWSASLTPATANSITTPALATKTTLSKNKKSSNNTSIPKTVIDKSGVAALSESLDFPEKNSNPWTLFLIALGLTIACGATIGTIKYIQLKKSSTHERS